jgi:hypothetical protein
MNFQKEDYLNCAEIKKLITSEYSHDKSKLIAKKLIKYCFVYNDELYELQTNKTYIQLANLKISVINKASLLIQKSHKKLSDTDKENIELKHGKSVKAILKNSDIETYYPQLLSALTRKDVVFNVTIGEIHFNNGYMNVVTKEFKERDIKHHVITKYIQRDYVPSTKSQKEIVMKHVKKVYPKQDDLDCILYYLGSALSWKGTQDQCALFLLGLGSSGKSFILELTKAVLGCYFVELASDTFSGTGTNINKVLNTYKLDSQILLSWVNEPVDKKMNGSLFKVWVDGNLQSTLLYKDGQFNFKHHSRCITTANTMPQIIVESGTTRRILSYTHQSHFTEIATEANESKHIYLLDKDIINKMTEKGLLNAWFDILVDYCYNWMKGIKPVYGSNFLETKEAIVNSSDIFQDFIDSKLKITNNDEDKIGKDKMKNEFLAMYPDKHLTTIQVMSSLKEHKLKYNMNLRSNDKIRGCFYGVKFCDNNNDDDDDNKDDLQDYENGVDKSNQSIDVNKELIKQLTELQAKYDKLLEKYNKIPELLYNKTDDNQDDEKLQKIKKSKPKKQIIEEPNEVDLVFSELLGRK